MAENRRGSKDKRFYLSRGQLVLLGVAFTAASIIIFFLGIFVGKGIEERRMAKNEEPSIKIPVKPSPQGSSGAVGAQAKEELTFYNTLTKSPAAEPVVEARPTEPKQPETVAKAVVKNGKAQIKEESPPAPKAVEKRPEKAVAATELSAKTQTAEAAEPRENDKSWTVQVNAFPDERSAKIWADRLKDKGYNAYVTEVRNKGKMWYRVRVGRYGSREEADKAVKNLRGMENFTQAFATNR
jgi:cell division septation protein DedD